MWLSEYVNANNCTIELEMMRKRETLIVGLIRRVENLVHVFFFCRGEWRQVPVLKKERKEGNKGKNYNNMQHKNCFDYS